MTDITTTGTTTDGTADGGHTLAQYLICMQGIVWREAWPKAIANFAGEWRLGGETVPSGVSVMIFSVSTERLWNLAVIRSYELKMIVPRLLLICKCSAEHRKCAHCYIISNLRETSRLQAA